MRIGETMQENPIESFQKIEEKELLFENKKLATQAWCEMVLGVKSAERDSEDMSDKEIRKWFSDSLEKGMDALVADWNLAPQKKLLEKIQTAEGFEEKSKAEVEYIFDCQKKIHALVENNSARKDHSTRWDSFPLLMRENGSFNCVGASMIGRSLLKKANIKNYYGNPTGHVVNMVILANGDLWYVDFLNGKKEVKKIKSEVVTICGVDVLEIKDEIIDYALIPLLDGEDAPVFILGNLHCLAYEAFDDELPENLPRKSIAKNFYNRFKDQFEKIDFGELERKLYPKRVLLSESIEMKNEKKRIDSLYEIYDRVFPAVKRSFSELNWKIIIAEAKENIEVLKMFFYQDNEEILSAISVELKDVLCAYAEKLIELKEHDTETYHRVVDAIIAGLSSSESAQ